MRIYFQFFFTCKEVANIHKKFPKNIFDNSHPKKCFILDFVLFNKWNIQIEKPKLDYKKE